MEFELCGVKLKDIQIELIDILLEFDRICNKYNLKYHLFAGTLLGAVRHNGFIPWDDDIDVCMLREDYEKFIMVCNKELSNKYFLQTSDTDPEYYKQFAKIRKNNTIFLEEAVSDLDIHHGLYIDIFPLDYVRPGTVSGIIQQKVLFVLGKMDLTRSKKLCLKAKNPILKFFRLSGHYFVKMIPKKLTDYAQFKIETIFLKKKSDYITHLTNGANKTRYLRFLEKKSVYEKSNFIDFEGYKLPVPENYESILTKLYGEYKKMPSIDEQASHHGVIIVSLNSKGNNYEEI